MRPGRALLALFAALALLAPSAAHAQRDTIRLGGDPEPRDTITLAAEAEDTAPARPERPARWSQPFAVEGSGEVAPRPPAREVVWLPADSVRARRLAARRDSAGEEADELAASDSAEAGDETDEAAEADSAPPPPRRAGSRTASRDTASSGRRTGGRATRADTASTSRRAASRDGEEDDEAAAETPRTTRRTASRDTTAATRRTNSRDTATTRRSASRDTAGTRRTASRDTASRRTTARPRTHRVASGETLFGIARRYAVTTAQIRALNPDLGETLEIGTVLRLPAGARAAGQPAAARDDDGERAATRRPSASRDDDDDDRPAPSRPAARARRHTVAAGETLYGIARRYGVTVDALRSANRLESDTVRPGQALTIPAAAPAQR